MLMSIDALSVLRAVDSPSATDRDLIDLADHMSQFVHYWAKTDHVAVSGALASDPVQSLNSGRSNKEYHIGQSTGHNSALQNEQLLRLYAQYY